MPKNWESKSEISLVSSGGRFLLSSMFGRPILSLTTIPQGFSAVAQVFPKLPKGSKNPFGWVASALNRKKLPLESRIPILEGGTYEKNWSTSPLFVCSVPFILDKFVDELGIFVRKGDSGTSGTRD